MYTIYAGNDCIYNDVSPVSDMRVIEPKLVLEDNTAGSLTMTLPPSHPAYDRITRMVTDITVRKHGKEIWAGRVLSEDRDFWNNRVLYCEGELAFLNDSIQPRAQYPGEDPRGFLKCLVDVHNKKVDPNENADLNENDTPNRRFTVGAVTVNPPANGGPSPSFATNYETTIDCIHNQLLEVYGGHLRIRKVNGERFLDYLSDDTHFNTNSQTIQFGKNLLDFTRNWDSTNFATVIVPLGKRPENSGGASDESLTVESVNNGSIYVASKEAVKEYGWIAKTVSWDDVSDPNVLLEKAKEYLEKLQFEDMELEVSAVDLHYQNADYEEVKLLDNLHVVSSPHGLDRTFLVKQLEIPLDAPENTKFTLGNTVRTSLTGVSSQTSSSIQQQLDRLPHSVLDEAMANASAILNLATHGYITIEIGKDGKGTDAIYFSNTPDYKDATSLWRWNLNGLAHWKAPEDGLNGTKYGDFDSETNPPQFSDVAITMDGQISANAITTGTLSADRVRTGILTSEKGGSYFNLNTGELVANSGLFSGTLTAAKLVGNLAVSSDYSFGSPGEDSEQNGWLIGCGIAVPSQQSPKFKVDKKGNVTFAPGCRITWAAGSSPVCVLYARTQLEAPTKKAEGEGYLESSERDWHWKLDTGNDFYVSYSYDGGETWTDAMTLQGRDGTDGGDANVSFDTIKAALQTAYENETTFITVDTVGAPCIYGAKIYGTEIYAGGVNEKGEHEQVIALTDRGIQLYNGKGNESLRIETAEGDNLNVRMITPEGSSLSLSALSSRFHATTDMKFAARNVVFEGGENTSVDFTNVKEVKGLCLRFS